MLKPSLNLRLGQQLTMTPQLQQAIRLLQLSTLELQAEIQETFESNPMLDRVDDESEAPAPADDKGEGERPEEADTGPGEEPQRENDVAQELPVDASWDDIYEPSGPFTAAPEDRGRDLFENQSGGDESLQEHLRWQLNLTPMSECDHLIGLALIDAVDEAGYLSESLDTIHANLASDLDIDLDEVEAVLHRIQQFDPLGTGARDLSECLSIQLQPFEEQTPGLAAARRLCADHLDLLAGRHFKQLMKLTQLSEAEVAEAVDLIQQLNPRPGAQISSRRPDYITPDVTVSKKGGVWRVELNSEISPRLRINPTYAGLIKRADQSEENTYLRNQLQEARWFIKSLQSRNETLLRVATAIVGHQRAFLEYGEEAMKPLVLRDIAQELEMHESTISRVTTHKYMYTPRGIVEFKYFFSSHVGTADGGVCSATAIRAMIRKLISEEDPSKPLSDNKIATVLGTKGINVARRTVAKYRESMHLPPSGERKRLA